MRIEEFLRKLDKLKRGGTKYGPAPHKPVFLISLLDLFDREGITENRFEISATWVALFKENWNHLVDTPHISEFGLPFFHLQTDGFWRVIRWDGTPLKAVIKSMFVLAEEVHHCELSPEVFELCRFPENASGSTCWTSTFPAPRSTTINPITCPFWTNWRSPSSTNPPRPICPPKTKTWVLSVREPFRK